MFFPAVCYAEDWIEKKSVDRMDRFTQFAIAASAQAMKDAGLDVFRFDPVRAGIIVGSGIGGIATMEESHRKLLEKGPRSVNPFLVSRFLINMAACNVSILYGLKGPLSAPSVACSTGANAIASTVR